MIVQDILYRGQSDLISITLLDDECDPIPFADLAEVEVTLRVNSVNVLTKKKTLNEVLAVAGEASMCKVAITDEETALFPKGLLQVRVSWTANDPDFVGGKISTVETAYKMVRD